MSEQLEDLVLPGKEMLGVILKPASEALSQQVVVVERER
jgi:hypothetical protein